MRLDKERERANRLERQQKEDEALSGELRELMANVDTAALPWATDGASPPTEPDAAPQTTVVAAAGATPPPEDVAKPLADEEDKETKGTRNAYGPLQGVGVLLSDWGLGGRGRAQVVGGNSNCETPTDEKLSPESSAEEASGGGGRGGGNKAPSGALRARVVELELQRAEAGELLKAKVEDSIQLQVQVRRCYRIDYREHSEVSLWVGECRMLAGSPARSRALRYNARDTDQPSVRSYEYSVCVVCCFFIPNLTEFAPRMLKASRIRLCPLKPPQKGQSRVLAV